MVGKERARKRLGRAMSLLPTLFLNTFPNSLMQEKVKRATRLERTSFNR